MSEKKIREEFCLPSVNDEASWRQGQLARAFSIVLDVFQDAATKAPRGFAEERVFGTATEQDVHRDVIDRLQQVHFIMQAAIARGYRP